MKQGIFSFFIGFILSLIPITYADNIAIIGGGASGLLSAWLLEKNHEITLYEAQNKLGGHADSIDIVVAGQSITIEGAAEFFTESYYPHFTKLLNYLKIPLNRVTLVNNFYHVNSSNEIILPPFHDGVVEWSSLTPENITRSIQLQLVIDNGRKLVEKHKTYSTFKQYADSLYVTQKFKDNFLYPFVGAAWGVSPQMIQNFSAYPVLKFLLEGNDALNSQWFQIQDGLKTYITALQNSLNNTKVKLNTEVSAINIDGKSFTVLTKNGEAKQYDQIIFATGANIASQLLKNLAQTRYLSELLDNIDYYKTTIAIHSDPRFMPSQFKDWRVENIRYNGIFSAATVYEKWKSKIPIFKSWLTYDVRANDDKKGPLPFNLYTIRAYQHPILNPATFRVQEIIKTLQGKQNIWFVGMWTTDDGSHESAIDSAINIAYKLAPNSERLTIFN